MFLPLRAALVASILACFPAAFSAAAPRVLPPERLPADHVSWDDLEELSVAGDLDSLWLYSRPVTRGEVARALLGARRSASPDPRRARMERQFAPELEVLEPGSAPAHFPPLVHAEGDDASLRIWPAIRAGVSRARLGHWRAGDESLFGGQAAFVLHPRALLYAEILVRDYPGSRLYAEPIFSNSDITSLPQRMYAGIAGGVLRAAAGRDRGRWGIGQSGSLVLGDAAPAANFVEYAVSWKRVHGVAITELLDNFGGKYLSGHRVEWRASRQVQLNISEVVRYDSRQPDLLYLAGVIPYTLVQRLNYADAAYDPGHPDVFVRNNIMAHVEGTWRPRAGLQLGAGFLVDEKSLGDSLPARLGWQLNALWTQRHAARPWTVRAELTRIDDYVYAVAYGRNFIHQGAPTAYPLGPDLRRATARLGWDPSPALKAWLSFDHLEKGEGRLGEFMDSLGLGPSDPPPSVLKGIVERSIELRLGGRCVVGQDVRVEGELGWAHTANAAHVAGRKEDTLVGRLALEWRR